MQAYQLLHRSCLQGVIGLELLPPSAATAGATAAALMLLLRREHSDLGLLRAQLLEEVEVPFKRQCEAIAKV